MNNNLDANKTNKPLLKIKIPEDIKKATQEDIMEAMAENIRKGRINKDNFHLLDEETIPIYKEISEKIGYTLA